MRVPFTVLLVLALALTGLLATTSAITASPLTEDAASFDEPRPAQGPIAHITHEMPPTGDTYVENLNRFGWILLDEDAKPIMHQNAAFTVQQDGAPLLATSPSSGHDYDGVDRYHLTTLQQGPYTVTVDIPHEGDTHTARFNGTAHEQPLTPATITHELPTQATAGEPTPLTYALETDQGDPIHHAHVLLEIWHTDEDRRIYQTTTHGHEANHEATITFPTAGDYEIRLTPYHASPKDDATRFASFTATHTLTVDEGATLEPSAPTREPLENTVDSSDSDAPYELFLTYDPYTSTGPWQKMRIAGVIVDPDTRTLVPHVDVHATLTAPDGTTLLETTQLHAYDGIVEIETAQPTIGDYTLTLEAESTRTDWTATGQATFSVHPPIAPMGAGPILVDLDGPTTLDPGQPADFTFEATTLGGAPYAHSEIAVTVHDEEDIVYSGKLHTHDDGLFPFTLTFPEPGAYTVHADPFPLTPNPDAPSLNDDARAFHVDVQPTGEDLEPLQESEETSVPWLGALLLIGTLGLAAIWRRR